MKLKEIKSNAVNIESLYPKLLIQCKIDKEKCKYNIITLDNKDIFKMSNQEFIQYLQTKEKPK